MSKKCLTILAMCLCLISLGFGVVYGTLDGIGLTPSGDVLGEDEKALAGNIIGVLQWAGFAIAVGMIIYIGIKYVMASADEKASLKSTVVKFIVGAFLIANATLVAGLIFK